jgi:hypothetical protein
LNYGNTLAAIYRVDGSYNLRRAFRRRGDENAIQCSYNSL